MMHRIKLLLPLLVLLVLSGCANGTGTPGVAQTYQPSATPNMDYIYRSPPPAAVRALR